MGGITIREMSDEEFRSGLSLVREVFLEFEAPDYSQEGVDSFFRSIGDEEFLSPLSATGAYDGEKLVGVIATRNESSHIALLFVNGRYQHQGIGKALFLRAVARCRAPLMTVNSSPYAVPFYHRLGFTDTGAEQVVCGIRFTPMGFVTGR